VHAERRPACRRRFAIGRWPPDEYHLSIAKKRSCRVLAHGARIIRCFAQPRQHNMRKPRGSPRTGRMPSDRFMAGAGAVRHAPTDMSIRTRLKRGSALQA